LGAVSGLTDAILYTLVYADLFDYPLTSQEIHRYLTCYHAPLAAVEQTLQADSRLDQALDCSPPFWFLSGREHLVELRRERASFSRALWQQALRYGRLTASVPFVRMVSITGSLAMNNVVSPQDDVDFLIIAVKGRLWLARGLVVLVVRLARRFGVELCPNYVIAEHRLELEAPSIFAAHEMAQLMPVYGLDMYHRFIHSNAWLASLLPNATPRMLDVRGPTAAARLGQRIVEATLRGRAGDAVERWESGRKIPRLRRIAGEQGGKGTSYTANLCKGHAADHGAYVYERYRARLAAQGMSS
jgi:hypothetical protein